MLLALSTAAWLRLGGLIVVVVAVLYLLGTYEERKEAVEAGEREDLGRLAPLAWPGKAARAVAAWLMEGWTGRVFGAVGLLVGWLIFLVIACVAVILVLNLVTWTFAPDPCAEVSDGQASCKQWEFWP
jgi:hypothetical protein